MLARHRLTQLDYCNFSVYLLQAEEPYPDENLLPPPEDSDEVESRMGSDLEEGEGEVSAPAGSEGDDGEDLMDNVSG